MANFPITRLRRLRKNQSLRNLISETDISLFHFIYPMFVAEAITKPKAIESMPGIMQWTPKTLVKEAKRVYELGIPAILLFGIPSEKDEVGTKAYAENGIIQNSIRLLKSALPDLLIVTDVCLCEYTSHGHCGVIKNGLVDNDPSLQLLSEMALSHVAAGADIVAPSDMLDGRVGVIRSMLDEHGFSDTPIMAYSAKYASAFFGPFREAAQSVPQFGDRKSYQMDPRNSREALREVSLDIIEGADIIMVKPALSYLDVIANVRRATNLPIAAYNVSGEYAMIKAAAQKGFINEQQVVLEVMTGIKRAGADVIISYFAPQIAEWVKKKTL